MSRGHFLSVVIPANYSLPYLADAIRSLSKFPESLELIVVENGSQELDEGQMRGLLPRKDVKLFSLATPDLSAARNYGLSHASGEFIYFLDSDDVVHAANLHGLLKRTQDVEADIAVLAPWNQTIQPPHNQLQELENGVEEIARKPQSCAPVLTGKSFLYRKLAQGRFSPVTGRFVFRRRFLERTKAEFAEGYFHEDYAFAFSQLIEADKVLIGLRPVFQKRTRPGSLSRSMHLTVSVKGYLKAEADIRELARFKRGLSAWWIARVLRLRIKAIVAKKRFQEAATSDNPLKEFALAVRGLSNLLGYLSLWAPAYLVEGIRGRR